MATNTTPPAAVQRLTLTNFIAAWETWSAEDMIACFSPDIQQRSMPLALGIPGRSRKEIEYTLPKLVQAVRNYSLKVSNVIHDTARNKAAIYAEAQGDTPFGDFQNEYACFVEFDDKGEKIKQLDEFMDSVFLMRFFPGFKRYLEEQSKGS
ncbi:hypothetical protein A1O3_02699 [Capronia epimyces CBS 606.96]|uniref:SnoaL-like domain-containing protein n=1 Tax=Capronia epimyces CBS 606.96 TaxID=1182542 RepID=W9Y9V2_9EURO|nr:uncharacterized protein A1O3_02699 [Capronia epimyces CBS 606.96]EXJ89632.1 hypothetical protein A1O3_02699 [Capronia epimyces CBS 606.96]